MESTRVEEVGDVPKTKKLKIDSLANDAEPGSSVKIQEAMKKSKQLVINILTIGKKNLEKSDLAENPKNLNEHDVVLQAKQIGEKLRFNATKERQIERDKLINELHSLLKGQDHYPKFVLASDLSPIVQLLLKYGSDLVKDQISEELIPVTLDMFQNKYGIFCLRRLGIYGSQETKAAIINKMYGNAVELSTNVLSAPLFENIYSTWTTLEQKSHLQQEFFGDMYKNSKDDNIQKLRDVFANSPDSKTTVLSATKSNLLKAVNKGLIDSAIIQSVLYQFLQECSEDDQSEIIPLLIPHIVVLSASRDGAHAAMQCILFGTNEDRKSAMETIKEHVVEMSKHEHAHCVIITLLDTAKNTVLLNDVILSEINKASRDLAGDEFGRKVLLWIVAPDDLIYFDPVFVKELEDGRNKSSSKKNLESRRKEILEYSIKTFINLIKEEPEFWLSKSALALDMLAIVKAGKGHIMKEIYKKIIKVVIDPAWKVKNTKYELRGIEEGHANFVLRKLARHDDRFAEYLLNALTDDIMEAWIKTDRGCNLLFVLTDEQPKRIKLKLLNKMRPHFKLLKAQKTDGGKLLLDAVYK